MSLLQQVNLSSPLVLGLSSTVVAYLVYVLLGATFRRSPLDVFPGPQYDGPSPLVPFERDTATSTMLKFVAQYGPVITFKRRFARPILMTTDVKAIAHMLQHQHAYDKAPAGSRPLARTLGTGLLVATGDEHRIQRKVLNPAFGPTQIRALTSVFLDKANELRDRLTKLTSKTKSVELDILDWYSRCTLDIIGLAGFGYDFAALDGSQQSEMAGVVNMFMQGASSTRKPPPLVIRMLMHVFPQLPMMLAKGVGENIKAMQRIGGKLVEERKAEASTEGSEKLKAGRDLLSLLVKANMSSSPRERMSDADMLGQIPTFLLAGHETTATLLTWLTYQLSLHPDIQSQLRVECREFDLPLQSSDNGALEADELTALDKLPLLDAVVRETLRLNAPVALTTRMAMQDDVLPLSQPLVDMNKTVHDKIPMKKGDAIVIPIFAINQSEELWGPDAKEWNPARWMDNGPPDSIRSIPGVWGHMMSFLGGSHACIGYRFSLYETKIILHALIRKFEFKLAIHKEQITVRSDVVTRTFVKGQEGKGPQLPVVLSLAGDA